MANAFFFLLLDLLCIAAAYFLCTIYAAWRFFRQPAPPAPATLPPVSLFKPLRGATSALYEQLASFCRLDYPCVQILCGVRDPQDPAVAIVKQLQVDFPTCDIALITNPATIGTNAKVSTLYRLAQEARHDIFVISDGDVSVPPDYLRQIVPPLLHPQVGVVTCPYRGEVVSPFPALLESLMINTAFTPQVLIASQVERTTYAFGATIAVKRQCIEEIGGFAAIANYLADDYHLGHRVTKAGYEARIIPLVIETHPSVNTMGDLFSHQLRWARTQRICRPGGYCSTLVTHGTVWALLGLLLSWSFPLLGLLAVCTLALRLLAAGLVGSILLQSSLTWRRLWLVPFTDLLSFVVWSISLFGNTVRWGEQLFRIDNNGKMWPIIAPSPSLVRNPYPAIESDER
jgi:ceramide glucosyltransferase